ncbi:MAG: 4'-phosphopantetheinyl transferase superfamily protein [Gemmatimonadetes bacterium]|nr:4'-phosphopantetheinyl transferase superfamily protein [Gemmatimonadota bacterium]
MSRPTAPHRAAGAPRPPAVGVDVVDLGDRRCQGKAADTRFVERVMAPVEAEAIAAAPDPDMALWRLWASKEAAFKVVSKMEGGPPTFVHATFVAAGEGAVLWQGIEVPVRLEVRDDALVALAWEPPGGSGAGVRWDVVTPDALDPAPDLELEALVRRHLHEEERPPVHSRPSALVRLGARRALATALAVDEARVSVVCPVGSAGRTPPVARLDGAPVAADVSLSHHGRYLAWAVRVAVPSP